MTEGFPFIAYCSEQEDIYIEDELIEALGIAANKVAYTTGGNNSIASTLIKGNLLQIAANHYFGDSNQFMMDYAPRLRSVIKKMKSNSLNEPKYYHGDNYEYEWVPLTSK